KFLHQDRRIGVEILLLDPAVFDGDLTMERRAQAKGEGAFDLRLDLLRIDDVAAVCRRHDAVDLQAPAFIDGHFRRRSHIAAIAVVLTYPAEDAFGRWSVPADPFRHRVEHA